MKYIFTVNKDNKNFCVINLKRHIKNFKFICWLSEEEGLFECDMQSEDFYNALNKKVVFVRHIFEVQEVFENNFAEHILSFAENNLDKNKTFTIQIRYSCSSEKVSLMQISESLEKQGYKLDVKNAQQILSCFAHNSTLYIGLGNKQKNLASYKGGMPHYREDENTICRAQFKLMEAFDVFDINTDNFDKAIDFGAAPGGWSKVLADKNLFVIAVDPAKLDERLFGNKNIVHRQITVGDYYKNQKFEQFDLIVNDMKMDADKALEILFDFKQQLAKNGLIISTLKLRGNTKVDDIENLLTSAHKHYDLMFARQLFHNRLEITIVLKHKM